MPIKMKITNNGPKIHFMLWFMNYNAKTKRREKEESKKKPNSN